MTKNVVGNSVGKRSSENLRSSGGPRVMTPGQDRYVMNRHQGTRFQTSHTTAANIPDKPNN